MLWSQDYLQFLKLVEGFAILINFMEIPQSYLNFLPRSLPLTILKLLSSSRLSFQKDEQSFENKDSNVNVARTQT